MSSLLMRELELERELELREARAHFLPFVQYTMPGYQVNWHHRVMAEVLERLARGQCKRLIVTTPPRHGKSQLISMHLPAFVLGILPKSQILAASYNATLAAKMNRAVQRIIDSPSYARVFPGTQLSASNIRTVASGNWLRNSDEFEVVGEGGVYRSAGVGGSSTGYGATLGLIDDPVRNRQDADSAAYQARVMDWFQSTFFTRLEKGGALCIVLTRWSERDLVGQLLELAKADPDADQWELLNLPAVAEQERHPDDPREIGDALWPGKYDLARLKKIRATVGEREWISLYQQRPAPLEGAIIKADWWQFYRELPATMDHYAISVDLTFKDREDYCAMQVWAAKGAQRYLVDQVHGRMEFNAQLAAFTALCQKYPQATTKLVEDAANGAALIATLKKHIQGIVPVRQKTSKELRVQAVSPQIEAGNVYLPKASIAPWIGRYQTEFNNFPAGAHDDQVDATSMYLLWAQQRSIDFSSIYGISLGRDDAPAWR